MKKLLLAFVSVLLLWSCGTQPSQPVAAPEITSTEEVSTAVNRLVQAMIDADEASLQDIASEYLVYGHSGGKVQNKSEFVAEVVSSDPLDYISIDLLDQDIKLAKDMAFVRHIFTAETLDKEGAPVPLRVGNLLVWKLQDGKLTLLLRQAYKI